MAAHPLAESEKTYLDGKRLRLFCVGSGTTLRAIETSLQLGRGNLHHALRRGWVRRTVAKEIARELGCNPSDFKVRHAD